MIYIQRLLKVVLMYQVSQVSQVKAKPVKALTLKDNRQS